MKNMIFREIVAPLTSRIGTAAAAVIVSNIHADTMFTEELGLVIAAGLLVGFDLIFSHFTNKRR